MTTCILCPSDLGPTERQTCQRCLAGVRSQLARVAELFAGLPSMLDMVGTGLSSMVSSSESRIPLEDVLVMLGPGSSGPGWPSDPPAVAFELGTWEDDWRHVRGEPAAAYAEGVATASLYLASRMGWAAGHHPAFDEFASDVRRILGWLEEATGTSTRPERGPPCPYCRADLLREWTVDGLADDWACGRCRRAFGPAQYLLAVRAALETEQERMRA